MAIAINLDDLRKKHPVAKTEFVLDGITFKVPAKLPMFVALKMGDEDALQDGLREWLGGDQYELFSASDISTDEFHALFEALYGASSGESVPSAS
ncbi:hypothetical protein [Propionibacterium freudenreichii]|uniref:hypothetical protein n=1 Tax=Propionibacterium freudenreichii TaxID=1744 RepID=UPI0021A7395D|nr:hypothetical protein [Propionibacterium freudenreichii]MCT2983702.1 hypothetical protein [Propionibacterium freudenreichii]